MPRTSDAGSGVPRWGIRLLLSVLLYWAFPGSPALPADSAFGDPIRGQALFQEKYCVKCHAVRGAGGRIGPDLGRKAVRDSFFAIAAGMWNHSLTMEEKMEEFHIARPAFAGTELSDLISFLYFLNYFDEPGNPRAGKTLFTAKHCIECHRVGGEGGTEGPSLEAVPRGESPLRIAQGLWNHGPAMIRAVARKGLEVPKFAEGEIVDLLAFLRSRGQREARREYQSTGDPGNGKRLFAAKGCARCHEIFGNDPGIGPDLGRAELRGSVTEIAGRMWNHWPSMAGAMEDLGMAIPVFREEDMADLFAYLFIARYDGLSGDPDRGRAVFRDKGCTGCHGERGDGGVGPSLRERTAGETKEAVIQRMWNHAPGMWSHMADRDVPWPRFQGQEMADLFAFFTAEFRREAPAKE